jgi:hypothetical protein
LMFNLAIQGKERNLGTFLTLRRNYICLFLLFFRL